MEISENKKYELCETLKRAKYAIEELEHELKSLSMDTRRGYREYDSRMDNRYGY